MQLIVGEAAGLAMGLVMLGSKSPTAIEDMVSVRIISLRIVVLCITNYYIYSYRPRIHDNLLILNTIFDTEIFHLVFYVHVTAVKYNKKLCMKHYKIFILIDLRLVCKC